MLVEGCSRLEQLDLIGLSKSLARRGELEEA